VEELSRVYSSSGDADVGKDKKREQIERQAYIIERKESVNVPLQQML
jgi:predicted RNA-binding protein YlxR (DUF448 family)